MKVGTYINYGDRSASQTNSITSGGDAKAYDPNQLNHKKYQAWFYQDGDVRRIVVFSSRTCGPNSQRCLGDFEYK